MEESKTEAIERRLRRHMPFLYQMLNSLNPQCQQYMKIKAICDMINKTKKVKYETLEKCETVIKLLQCKAKRLTPPPQPVIPMPVAISPPPPSTNSNPIYEEIDSPDNDIRSPSPNNSLNTSPISPATSERYAEERPSIYDTVGDTLIIHQQEKHDRASPPSKPKEKSLYDLPEAIYYNAGESLLQINKFDGLGTMPITFDTSKPPISAEDLEELLQSSSTSNDAITLDPDTTPVTVSETVSHKSKVSLVPTPFHKKKRHKNDTQKNHVSEVVTKTTTTTTTTSDIVRKRRTNEGVGKTNDAVVKVKSSAKVNEKSKLSRLSSNDGKTVNNSVKQSKVSNNNTSGSSKSGGGPSAKIIDDASIFGSIDDQLIGDKKENEIKKVKRRDSKDSVPSAVINELKSCDVVSNSNSSGSHKSRHSKDDKKTAAEVKRLQLKIKSAEKDLAVALKKEGLSVKEQEEVKKKFKDKIKRYKKSMEALTVSKHTKDKDKVKSKDKIKDKVKVKDIKEEPSNHKANDEIIKEQVKEDLKVTTKDPKVSVKDPKVTVKDLKESKVICKDPEVKSEAPVIVKNNEEQDVKPKPELISVKEMSLTSVPCSSKLNDQKPILSSPPFVVANTEPLPMPLHLAASPIVRKIKEIPPDPQSKPSTPCTPPFTPLASTLKHLPKPPMFEDFGSFNTKLTLTPFVDPTNLKSSPKSDRRSSTQFLDPFSPQIDMKSPFSSDDSSPHLRSPLQEVNDHSAKVKDPRIRRQGPPQRLSSGNETPRNFDPFAEQAPYHQEYMPQEQDHGYRPHMSQRRQSLGASPGQNYHSFGSPQNMNNSRMPFRGQFPNSFERCQQNDMFWEVPASRWSPPHPPMRMPIHQQQQQQYHRHQQQQQHQQQMLQFQQNLNNSDHFHPFEPIGNQYDLSKMAPQDFYMPQLNTPQNYRQWKKLKQQDEDRKRQIAKMEELELKKKEDEEKRKIEEEKMKVEEAAKKKAEEEEAEKRKVEEEKRKVEEEEKRKVEEEKRILEEEEKLKLDEEKRKLDEEKRKLEEVEEKRKQAEEAEKRKLEEEEEKRKLEEEEEKRKLKEEEEKLKLEEEEKKKLQEEHEITKMKEISDKMSTQNACKELPDLEKVDSKNLLEILSQAEMKKNEEGTTYLPTHVVKLLKTFLEKQEKQGTSKEERPHEEKIDNVLEQTNKNKDIEPASMSIEDIPQEDDNTDILLIDIPEVGKKSFSEDSNEILSPNNDVTVEESLMAEKDPNEEAGPEPEEPTLNVVVPQEDQEETELAPRRLRRRTKSINYNEVRIMNDLLQSPKVSRKKSEKTDKSDKQEMEVESSPKRRKKSLIKIISLQTDESDGGGQMEIAIDSFKVKKEVDNVVVPLVFEAEKSEEITEDKSVIADTILLQKSNVEITIDTVASGGLHKPVVDPPLVSEMETENIIVKVPGSEDPQPQKPTKLSDDLEVQDPTIASDPVPASVAIEKKKRGRPANPNKRQRGKSIYADRSALDEAGVVSQKEKKRAAPRKSELDILHADIKQSLGDNVFLGTTRRCNSSAVSSRTSSPGSVKSSTSSIKDFRDAELSQVKLPPSADEMLKMAKSLRVVLDKVILPDNARSVSPLSTFLMNTPTGVPKRQRLTRSVKLSPPEVETKPIEDQSPVLTPVVNDETKIDLKVQGPLPDKEYYLKTDVNSCKLCEFIGPQIITHYIQEHPDSEVLISRLSPESTQEAFQESMLNDYANIKVTDLGGRKFSKFDFRCRFCYHDLQKEFTSAFYDHLCSHTGEARYHCTECSFKHHVNATVKNHMILDHKLHKHPRVDNPPKNYDKLFGYICSECNFLQLRREAVEEHIKVYHVKDQAYVYTINMSLPILLRRTNKAIPEMDVASVEGQRKLRSSQRLQQGPLHTTTKKSEEKHQKMGTIKNIIEKLSTTDDVVDFDLPAELLENEKLKDLMPNNTKRKESETTPPSTTGKTIHPVTPSSAFVCENWDEVLTMREAKQSTTIPAGGVKRNRSIVDKLKKRLDEQESSCTPDDAPPVEVVESEDIVTFKEPWFQTPIDKEISYQPPIDIEVNSTAEMPPVVSSNLHPRITVRSPSSLLQKRLIIPSIDVMPTKNNSSIISTVSRLRDTLNSASDTSKSTHISVGCIDARVRDNDTVLYICRNPSCIFQTTDKRVFEVHCTYTHCNAQLELNCSVCLMKEKMRMLDVFFHLRTHVDSYQQSRVTLEMGPRIKIEAEDLPEETEADTVKDPMQYTENLTTLPVEPVITVKKEQVSPPRMFFKISKVESLAEADPQPSPTQHNMPPPLVLRNPIVLSQKTPTPKVKSVPLTLSAQELKAPRKHPDVLKKWLENGLGPYLRCPKYECDFVTTVQNELETHIIRHEFKEPVVMCLYCNYKIKTEYYTTHLMMRHARCPFGCGYCLYRALRKEYVSVHHQLEHAGKEMNLQSWESPNLQSQVCEVLTPIDVLLKPYVCRCDRKFYSPRNFECHRISCYGRSKIPIPTLSNLFLYNCRYCEFGAKTGLEIACHIAIQHSFYEISIISRQFKDGIVRDPEPTDVCNYFPILGIEVLSGFYTEILSASAKSSPPIQTIMLTTSDKNNQKGIPHLMLFHSLVLPQQSNQLRVQEPTTQPILEPKQDIVQVSEDQKNSTSGDVVLFKDLYRCNNCLTIFSNAKVFHMHVKRCKTDPPLAQRAFVCFHCKKDYKLSGYLVEHIRQHGCKNLICGLCGHKETKLVLLRKHVKNEHKLNNIVLQPVDPAKTNLDVDLFIGKPYVLAATPTVDTTTDTPTNMTRATPNTFGPSELNALPMRSIFPFDAKCSACDYSSKVRSNFIRHLQLHSTGKFDSSLPVAEVVNPVPCLEKNELMFDKMTNLAASSHEGRMSGLKATTPAVTIEPMMVSEDVKIPEFIPENRRFVCGASGCQYLCLEEQNLRHHLQALHDKEQYYKCTHCEQELNSEKDGNKTFIDIDAIVGHLRLHENSLHKCFYCDYLHNNRAKIERHCLDKHSDKGQKVVTIRQDVDADTFEQRKKRPWRCGICAARKCTLDEIKIHTKEKHTLQAQFKCTYCHFRDDVKSTFGQHFHLNHPELSPDIIVAYFYEEKEDGGEKDVQAGSRFDTTPLWVKNRVNNVKNIRGILLDEEAASIATVKKPAVKTISVKRRLSTKNVGGETQKSPKQIKIDNIIPEQPRNLTNLASTSTKTCKFVLRYANNYPKHVRFDRVKPEVCHHLPAPVVISAGHGKKRKKCISQNCLNDTHIRKIIGSNLVVPRPIKRRRPAVYKNCRERKPQAKRKTEKKQPKYSRMVQRLLDTCDITKLRHLLELGTDDVATVPVSRSQSQVNQRTSKRKKKANDEYCTEAIDRKDNLYLNKLVNNLQALVTPTPRSHIIEDGSQSKIEGLETSTASVISTETAVTTTDSTIAMTSLVTTTISPITATSTSISTVPLAVKPKFILKAAPRPTNVKQQTITSTSPTTISKLKIATPKMGFISLKPMKSAAGSTTQLKITSITQIPPKLVPLTQTKSQTQSQAQMVSTTTSSTIGKSISKPTFPIIEITDDDAVDVDGILDGFSTDSEPSLETLRKMPIEELHLTNFSTPHGNFGTPSMKYKCPHCKKQIIDVDEFRQHLYEELKCMRLECVLCGAQTTNFKQMNEHYSAEHLALCEFDSVRQLEVTEVELYVRKVIYVQQRIIKYNKKKWRQDVLNKYKSYACGYCDFKSSSHSVLLHTKSSHGNVPFKLVDISKSTMAVKTDTTETQGQCDQV